MNTDVVYNEDCIDGMKRLPDHSIDMVLSDLPYSITANAWDKALQLGELWTQYKRVIKPRGAIVLFASGKFTFRLVTSNESMYRYKWIWHKSHKTNFVNAKNRPLSAYEEILVFSDGLAVNGHGNKMRYYPQGLTEKRTTRKCSPTKFGGLVHKRPCQKDVWTREYTNYPCDILDFPCVAKPQHPSEKPVELAEYLVRTYTKEGDTVLDSCIGSGTTAVACINTNRHFLGFELEKEYFDIACKRIADAQAEKESELAFG